jgi:hypothetical protein
MEAEVEAVAGGDSGGGGGGEGCPREAGGGGPERIAPERLAEVAEGEMERVAPERLAEVEPPTGVDPEVAAEVERAAKKPRVEFMNFQEESEEQRSARIWEGIERGREICGMGTNDKR